MTLPEQTNIDKKLKDAPADSIQAVEIDLTASNSGSQTRSQDRHSASSSSPLDQTANKRGLLITLAACVIVALAVVFVLPSIVADRQQQSSAQTNEKNLATLPSDLTNKAPQQSSSLIDQRELQARRKVQDALIRIREKQSVLQDKNIDAWATNEYEGVLANLQQGDLYYREQLYSKSLETYSRAEANLNKLEAQIEPRLKQALSDGFAALEIGDADGAMESFGTALAIEPAHTETKQGMERLQVLPEVLEHVARGDQLLNEGSPEEAISAFEQALTLDPKHSLARAGHGRAQQNIDDARYQSAMSAGFSYLNAGEYQRAANSFKQALSVVPKSSDARSALTEAQARHNEGQIENLLSQARANEEQENWQDAANNYQLALKRDNTIAEARVGQIRASTRAELDNNMNAMLADTLRLASRSVYRGAEQLLADAEGIGNPGTRLSEQIGRLQQAITAARIPVSMTLQSDNLTTITLLKVGELGTFTRKQLELTPGRYVVKGYRPGYRDVRVEFSITAAGANPQVVRVQCNEII